MNETHFFEEFAPEIVAFQSLGRKQLYHIVNRMITIQRKDYYRKSEYEEYPKEARQILSEYEENESKRFETLNKIVFCHEAKLNSKARSGDQTPRHVFYIDEIFSMYPNGKVIHMVRDPRAVLYSQKKKWVASLRRKQPLFEVIRTFLNYHPLTLSILWCKAVSAGLNAQARHGNKKVLTVKFEELVSNPKDYVSDICKFLGETFNSKMLDVTVELSANMSQEGKRGVSQSVASQWVKSLGNTEVFICERIAGSLMLKLGYSRSERKHSYIVLSAFAIWLPFHLLIAFLMNIGRMGNPLIYISKRIF